VNLVGLRRAGFDAKKVAAIKRAYRLLYREGLRLEIALERIEAEIEGPEARELAAFVRGSKRGICRE
jgi:UDP-N-acetylglucosamine acyltransferase